MNREFYLLFRSLNAKTKRVDIALLSENLDEDPFNCIPRIVGADRVGASRTLRPCKYIMKLSIGLGIRSCQVVAQENVEVKVILGQSR
jgi:hypothetical protein